MWTHTDQLMELENLGCFMNILFHYSFHVFCAEQVNNNKVTFSRWSEIPFLSWFSNGSTRKLAVVCTRSFRFPYITKVLCSSLFHKAEKNHRCQPSKLVAVIGFIKSTIVWSFEERKKVSSCIFKNTLHLVLLKGLKKWKMRPDIVCSSGP